MTQPILARRGRETPDPAEEYEALRNGLRRTEGFGLFFVQCSPAEGTRLAGQIREDLPQKQVDVLRLTEPITNLYEIVDGLPNKDDLDVLFIQGIEHSLYDYEKSQLWKSSGEQYSYSQKGVPQLLGHLNLSRERFRDNFKICFVFLVPLFALKYLIRRAPDFFDWRSGLLEFVMDADRLQAESLRTQWARSDWEEYKTLTPPDRRSEIFKIQALIEEPKQSDETKAELYLEQGLLYAASDQFEQAVASYDRALHYKSNNYQAWDRRGTALDKLRHYEESLASYDEALIHKPDFQNAWYNRSVVLSSLGRYEEAITSFDQALEYKLDDHEAWLNRGVALENLERNEEALASFDRVLEYKPDNHQAWYNRGVALGKLGRNEEALSSYDQAVQHKPDKHEAWYNRGYALSSLGCYEESLASFDQALEYKLDKHETWISRGAKLCDNLGRYEEAIASFEESLKCKPNDPQAWYGQGVALGKLRRTEEAIASFDTAVQHEPDYHDAWNNRGNALGNLGRYEEAIASHEKALEIRRSLNDKQGEANSLLALANLYYRSGKVREGWLAGLQASQILQELELPLEEMPYPNWLKRLVKFAQRGKLELALTIAAAIIALPLLPLILLGILSITFWHWLRFTGIRFFKNRR